MKIVKITKNIIDNEYMFSLVAKITSIITGLIFSILFARYLGAQYRGEAAIIANYSELISLFLCLGIFQAYPYFKKKYQKDIYMEYINYVFTLVIFYFIIGILVVILFPIETKLLIAILLAPIYMAIRQLNYAVLIENPKLRSTASIKLDIVDILLLIILMLFTKVNYFYCIFYVVCRQLVSFIISLSHLQINLFSIRPKIKGIGKYIKYGIIPLITIICMELNYKVDIIMLERFHVTASSIGIYSLGVMLAQRIWMVPDSLKEILMSKLSKGKTAEEVAKVTRISFFITTLVVILMILIGKPLIYIMYGYEYIDAYQVTVYMLAGVLGMVFYHMIYSYNIVYGNKTINLVLLLFSAMINVVINMFLIPKYEIIGAAIASLISYLICGFLFLVYFCSVTGIKHQDMIFIKKSDITSIFKILKSNHKKEK